MNELPRNLSANSERSLESWRCASHLTNKHDEHLLSSSLPSFSSFFSIWVFLNRALQDESEGEDDEDKYEKDRREVEAFEARLRKREEEQTVKKMQRKGDKEAEVFGMTEFAP